MSRRILAAVGGLMAIAVAAAWAIAGPNGDLGPRPADKRSGLALLTSLPLVFGESFGLQEAGSPTLSRLEQRYQVKPIGVADSASLRGQQILLMAHPRAQPADVLVDLDQWVRRGGKLLLLADPKLDWPSGRPLGDRLRPAPAFADTGLLMHWGMKLQGPSTDGPTEASNGRISVKASSAGQLSSRSCEIAGYGFVARCRIGRGNVTVVADADFLNVENGDEGQQNLDLMVDELARLESR